MRQFLLRATIGLLVLSACTASTIFGSPARYRIDVRNSAELSGSATGTGATTGTDRRSELLAAAKRVVERRLKLIGAEDATVRLGADDPILIVDGVTDDGKAELTRQLTAPFSLKFMKHVETGGTLTVEGHGGFVETSLNGSHALWVTADGDELTGKGVVAISFTEEGKRALQRLFKENPGRIIGIFVRDKLVSKRTLSAAEKETIEMISIADVPTPEIATVFADDVNVGLHVTFVPLE